MDVLVFGRTASSTACVVASAAHAIDPELMMSWPSLRLATGGARRGGARLECGAALALVLALALTPALLLTTAATPAHADDTELARIEALVEAGDAARALDLLAARGKSLGARELMLRGMAKVILGELRGGADDLEQAVERDPGLRQGWMNLAGLEIAEGDWQEAHRLLKIALDLDPSAPDGHLNLGAVLVMMGRSDEAARHFARYLELSGGGGEEHYLVATNYALAGAEHLAIEHLEKAFERNERLRLRARQDDRFLGLDSLEYRVLLSTDSWTPPADWRTGAAAFRQRYQRDDGVLLYAVLDSLRSLDVPYDGNVEATARWALIWAQGELRIKLFNQDDGTGVVKLMAPSSSFSEAQWQRMTQEVFRGVHSHLATAVRRPAVPRRDPPPQSPQQPQQPQQPQPQETP